MKRFGAITILSEKKTWRKRGKRASSSIVCECRCACGKTFHTKKWRLSKGRTFSCGCLRDIVVDGINFGSVLEAAIYLDLKDKQVVFQHDSEYDLDGLGKHRYDFFIPATKTYIETSSYSSSVPFWGKYISGIENKRKAVESAGCNLLFICRKPTVDETTRVCVSNTKKRKDSVRVRKK